MHDRKRFSELEGTGLHGTVPELLGVVAAS